MVTPRQKWSLELCCHDPENAQGYPGLEEAREDPSLGTSEGIWPCQHLDFGLLAPKLLCANRFLLLQAAQFVALC